MVNDVEIHPNADLLEIAVIDGWKCIVKKGEFVRGDIVVYFEVDSVLPVREEFEFLRKSSYVSRPFVTGFRLRTMRLRGQLSQGLVMHLANIDVNWENEHKLPGADVTELLGVVKWDPPLPANLGGEVNGWFPSFIPRTDQERIQNLTEEVAAAAADSAEFEVTIKLDGASCTIFANNGEVGVCSRNFELKVNDANKKNSFVRMFIDSGMEKALVSYGRDIAFQGELMGAGIQGNRENFGEARLYVYDIYDITQGRYLTPFERLEFEFDGFKNVYHIPSLGFSVPTANIDEMLAANEGPSINHPVREGTVWKRIDGAFSFKIISNRFLESEK
jgi:RNA ligase (TIGR02306 family)